MDDVRGLYEEVAQAVHGLNFRNGTTFPSVHDIVKTTVVATLTALAKDMAEYEDYACDYARFRIPSYVTDMHRLKEDDEEEKLSD